MDSDDIAVPDRFEKQMAYIEAHPDVDALGGQRDEFIGEPSYVVGTRIVPLTDAEIKAYVEVSLPNEPCDCYVKEGGCAEGWRLYRLVL